MRAVILDENGIRIKDITLKKVVNDDSGVLSPGQYKANRGIVTNNNQKDRVILWNKHMITEILKDITYLGHLAQRKASQCLYAGISFHRTEEQDWIIVENTHEPIIEQEHHSTCFFEALSISRSASQENILYMKQLSRLRSWRRLI